MQEKQLIEQMLIRNELRSDALNFLKDWVGSTKFKLPIVVDILNEPLKYPGFVQDTKIVLEGNNPCELIDYFSNILFAADVRNKNLIHDFDDYFTKKVKKTKDIFSYTFYVWEKADFYYKKAWQEISEEEKKKLEYFTYELRQEEEDSLRYQDFYKKNDINEFDDLEIEDMIPIVEKINFQDLMSSAYIFQVGFDILKNNLKKKDFSWKKRLVKESPWGIFCIGSKKVDIYNNPYCLILDPGGDDVYSTEIRTNFTKPFYWMIDLSGNDFYHSTEIGELFFVLFGLGINFDKSGDDVYLGNDFAFSTFFGYQLSQDLTGDDIYSCGLHSTGAATFGLSVLLDGSGNDNYSITEFGQGFGGTLAAGLIIDNRGNDRYYAGGKYLHEPLVPFDHRSMAQGFGYGVRPDLGGGIGIINDKQGNDSYQGGVYAQAVAYWYALGMIIDNEGNDFYDAVYYPQGSGIHLAGGFLYDEKGEDHYYSKHGPGQGAAHDYAVGFLVDRQGNDIYSVEGGNGLGLTNSTAIFLDVSGDDRYERNFASNYGFANKKRESGSIGIFLDTGGNDEYPLEYCLNDTSWQKGTYGIGLDTLLVENIEPVEEKAEEEVMEIDSLAEISEIFKIASGWGVGSNTKKVKKAGELLIKRDIEAARYIYDEKLGTKSGLEFRAIKNFVKKSDEFKKYISPALHHTDSLWIKTTISLLGELADSTYIDSLNLFLERGKYKANVLAALGKMKSDQSTIILQKYMDANSEKLRVITARGLKKINSKTSKELLRSMKNDQSFLIRSLIKLMDEK